MTPTGRHVLTYDDESWKPSPEDLKSEELSRSSDTRQSTTKRVKKYLKKCKNALRSSSSESHEEASSTSSWYLDELINESEVNELEDIYEDVQCVNTDRVYQVASVVNVVKAESEVDGNAESSPPLTEGQGKVDGIDGDGVKPQAVVSVLIGFGDPLLGLNCGNTWQAADLA